MNYDNNFIRLINKFDCAVNQISIRKLYVSYSDWNMTVSPNNLFSVKKLETPTNPFAIILEGHKINKSLFGIMDDYRGYSMYCRSHYPYMQIERMFMFPAGTLYGPFYQGFCPKDNYKNVYSEEGRIAFDLGRYLLKKYFGHNLPIYNSYKWMR